ncbi:SCO family protein [Bacillus mesophilus]|uniref:SCO family protein n=1 Tax=Bacillus mesophilus TaxID=1808955 RepID=A0A6M0QCD3_9BACI|nr:SCO family protein [Bacillus mesophilus]NEY73956.1 SCO family protein [Bacillus mesophilus]
MMGLFFSLLLIVSGCGGNGLEVPSDATTVENFTFTNQNGEEYGLEQLKGKVWVADFIFTNCDTVCPPLTANMSKLQDMAKEKGLEVEFVSFSVDPENDTPEKLLTFGEQFDADFTNWNFLTGYSQSDIEAFAPKSFAAIVQKPKSDDQVIHGLRFYIVNQDGIVVSSYNGLENPPYEQMLDDISKLQ